MADEKVAASWYTTVPEIFYDLMARMLPGFTLFVGTVDVFAWYKQWILHTPVQVFGLLRESGIVVLTFGVTFSWILGLLLTAYGDMLWRGKPFESALIRILPKYRDALQKAEDMGIVKHYGTEVWLLKDHGERLRKDKLASEIYQQLHEYLKGKKSEWQGILTKNQAEVTFYANTSIGLLLVLLGFILVIVAATILHVTHTRENWFELVYGGVGPPVALLFASLHALSAKVERLWRRHMVFLSIDIENRYKG